mgnify:CR=1 FL=1
MDLSRGLHKLCGAEGTVYSKSSRVYRFNQRHLDPPSLSTLILGKRQMGSAPCACQKSPALPRRNHTHLLHRNLHLDLVKDSDPDCRSCFGRNGNLVRLGVILVLPLERDESLEPKPVPFISQCPHKTKRETHCETNTASPFLNARITNASAWTFSPFVFRPISSRL